MTMFELIVMLVVTAAAVYYWWLSRSLVEINHDLFEFIKVISQANNDLYNALPKEQQEVFKGVVSDSVPF